MEKKNFFNRKNKIILSLIALVTLAMGGTFAWWIANKKVEQTVQMGELDFTADFPELSLNGLYEPGLQPIKFNGVIKNTGNLSIAIKIENDSQLKFIYQNDDKVSIPENEQKFEDDSENLVALSFEPKDGDYYSNADAYWFTDITNPDTRILLLEPKGTIEVTNQAVLSNQMSNRYQGATIKIGANLKGTQVLNGALSEVFNVKEENMVPLENTSNMKIQARSFSAVKSQDRERATKRLQELLQRGSN